MSDCGRVCSLLFDVLKYNNLEYVILTEAKNQVIHRRKNRKLSKRNRYQCQRVLKLSGSQGSLKNRNNLRRVRDRVQSLLLMFVILSTLMIRNTNSTIG